VDIHTVISAFSGIGGLDIGVGNAIRTRTIAYIEREASCARILAQRMLEGYLQSAPIFSDIEQFPAEIFAGKTHGLIGGFPCQPWSGAGKGKGEFDEKGRNLWPQTIGLIRALQPEWVFLENVSNLIVHKYFGRILGDLASSGFDIEYDCFTAAQAGAPHKRERVFVLAYRPFGDAQRRSRGGIFSGEPENEDRNRSEFDDVQMADSDSGRGVEGFKRPELRSYRTEQSPGDSRGTDAGQEQKRFFNGVGEFPPGPDDPAWEEIIKQFPELAPATCKHEPPARPQMYEVESAVRRMDDAGQVEDRVASLMALGNSVVPHQAELAFRTLASRI